MTGGAVPNSPHWYARPELVRQLPFLYRWAARYFRALAPPGGGPVRGGSFLLRRLADLGRILPLPGSCPLAAEGVVLHVDLTDPRLLDVLREILAASPERAVIEHFLRPGDSFLDVGANHGVYALFAARRVGESGRVLAFEPQARLAELVERSLRDTALAPFEVHAVALGAERGKVVLFRPRGGSGSAGLFREFSGRGKHREIPVPLRTLDEMVRKTDLPGRILVKLDVEGSELAFLEGAAEFLGRRRPLLLFELNPISARAAGYGVEGLLDRLEELGYTTFAEAEEPDRRIPRREVALSPQRNLLAFHRGGAEERP